MAKAIADRIDVGMVGTRLRPIDELAVESFVNDGYLRPNYVISFYKIRRGKFAGTKLWCDVDLGTCRMKGLFLTDSTDTVIPIDKTTINVKKQAEKEIQNRDRKEGSNKFKSSAF